MFPCVSSKAEEATAAQIDIRSSLQCACFATAVTRVSQQGSGGARAHLEKLEVEGGRKRAQVVVSAVSEGRNGPLGDAASGGPPENGSYFG